MNYLESMKGEMIMNEVKVFENEYLEVFKELSKVTNTKKELEAQEKKIKANLEEAMDAYDIKSIDNQYIKITRVNGSTSTSIDLKAMEKEEPELYEELLEDYPKTTVRSGYVRFTVK